MSCHGSYQPACMFNAFLSSLPASKPNNARERVKLPSFAAIELGYGKQIENLV